VQQDWTYFDNNWCNLRGHTRSWRGSGTEVFGKTECQ